MEENGHFKCGTYNFTSTLYSETHFKTCRDVNDSLTQSIPAHKFITQGCILLQGFLTSISTIV